MSCSCLCNSKTIQRKIIHGALFEKNEILVGHDALASYDASYDSSYWHHILYDAMASSDANASYDASVLHMMQMHHMMPVHHRYMMLMHHMMPMHHIN